MNSDFVKDETLKLLQSHTWKSRANVVHEQFEGWRECSNGRKRFKKL